MVVPLRTIVELLLPVRVRVPVALPMEEAEEPEALMLAAAPVIVSPALPVRRPADVIVPLLVVDIFPVVVIASPAVAGCNVVPLLLQ